MDPLEFEQYSEAFQWALTHKELLKAHEPQLLKFIEIVEKRIEFRVKELGFKIEGKGAVGMEVAVTGN
jgi:hypothetical protein